MGCDSIPIRSYTALAPNRSMSSRERSSNASGGFLHATGFLLRPDGEVAQAVYATGPIGRLVPLDTLRVLEFLQRSR